MGFESARMGGVMNAALRLNSSNKLVFRNTFTHDSEKEARQFSGLNGGIDNVIQAERLRWIETRFVLLRRRRRACSLTDSVTAFSAGSSPTRNRIGTSLISGKRFAKSERTEPSHSWPCHSQDFASSTAWTTRIYEPLARVGQAIL